MRLLFCIKYYAVLDSRLRGNDRRGTSGMTEEERDCFASLAMTGEAACAGMTEGERVLLRGLRIDFEKAVNRIGQRKQ
jgi:hypothetical protein